MYITDRQDGIHILGHGVMSVSKMMEGTERLDPFKLREALAKINRYAGNTGVPWNDAEHSLLVATLTGEVTKLVDVEELFLKRPTVVDTVKLWRWLQADSTRRAKITFMAYTWGLLHDVVEVVVGDTPNPVKKANEDRGDHNDVEEVLVSQLKVQTLGRYAYSLAQDFTGLHVLYHGTNDLVAHAILDLLQDYVKPADKLALLVEMSYMHNNQVLDYVYDLWQVNPATKEFVADFKWGRLAHQAGFEGIDWRTSARLWGAGIHETTHMLGRLFL